jgi:hypothetical protein
MTEKPKVTNSLAERELDKAEKQLNAFEDNLKEMTLDRMNQAPKEDVEPQTKLSQSEIEKSKDIYLKPSKMIGSKEKFNERLRDKYNFDKEYVQFVAENKEIIGETIDIWTKPYPGMPAEYWQVPCNKPVWGPRYLAEQIKKSSYHRFVMQQNVITEATSQMQMYGSMAVDTTVQRLDAHPVSRRKSIFMGASSFA